ncbi:aldo/keto reductase [Kribbella antibiotica]|uniref:Aldo/keto reductase n=1 Tax=Kribbella antibiotica TaxID=190195 RepID=A0A4R4ZG20_9ACTN|nr:aldo/keto reductase [Kribbella antibiotica]TDD56339.1 aldo/keto reductase [Kribbella antibiotica]
MMQRTLAGRRPVSALCLGAMNFGSSTDPETAIAILDRFVEAGGTFIDTSNNYNQWLGTGGDSEELLGRWMHSRKNRDQLVIATKVGARTTVAGDPGDQHWEGLRAGTVAAAVEGSLARLGTDRIDLYYAHIDDRVTPLDETVGALGRLAADGVVDLVGCSNTATWRLEQARRLAADQGVEAYSVIQQHSTYLWPSPLAPIDVRRGSPFFVHATVEHFDYLAEHPDLTLVAYASLLGGSYAGRPFPANRGYAHPSAYGRFEELRRVAREVGATANQVVLAWMLHRPQVVPLFGASTVAQLEEALDAVQLELSDDQLQRLDTA